MASFCRSAAAAAVRSSALRPRSPMARPFLATRSPIAPPRRRRPFVAAALASTESLMPLHSAVAAARLRSCMAADSSCWSSLSQVARDMSGSLSCVEEMKSEGLKLTRGGSKCIHWGQLTPVLTGKAQRNPLC